MKVAQTLVGQTLLGRPAQPRQYRAAQIQGPETPKMEFHQIYHEGH